MKKLRKKGDIEISKLIGLIIGVIALILIITFIYLNWKPLKESLGKIGENVLGQTKDLLEVDKKKFYDQTLTTQDQQLDEMIGDITKKFDCTIQPDAAITRWKKAIEIISGSKYKGKWKGREPELQYRIIECYSGAGNCAKVSEEFKALKDKIQERGAFDYTSKACAEFFNCLDNIDRTVCEERVSRQGKVLEKEKLDEAIQRLKLDGLIGFNKKYKEAIDNLNAKRYKRAEDISGDLADTIYAILPKGFPKSDEPTETCDNISSKYNIERGLCLQRDSLYLSSRYVEIFSKFRATNNCEEMESDYINDFAGNILSLKDETSDLKYIRFIKGTNVGASDLSGQPVVGQGLYDLGKCFEQRGNEQKVREHFNSLLVSYPDQKIAETLIKEKEPDCKSFSKKIGFNTDECNNVNLWLNDKDPRINFDIKRKLRCWDDKMTGVWVKSSTCNSCSKITKCADYDKIEQTCIRDPCGFNCKLGSASLGAYAECVPS